MFTQEVDIAEEEELADIREVSRVVQGPAVEELINLLHPA